MALTSAWAMPDAAQGACLDPPADLDGSGDTNVVDVQCGIVTALVLLAEDGSEMPSCLAGSEETADVDCGGGVDVVDIIIIIQYVLGLPIDTALDADGNSCPDACEETTGGEGGDTEPFEPVGSCEGICGDYADDCYCDSECLFFGDCCSDFEDHCEVEETEPVDTSSCEGMCGEDAGDCYCDTQCLFFDDCCADYEAVCIDPDEDPTGSELPAATESCENSCGWGGETCSCDALCTFFGDCCSDYTTYCGE